MPGPRSLPGVGMPCPMSLLGAGGEVLVGIPGGRYTRGSGYTRGGWVGIPGGRYTRGGMYTHPPTPQPPSVLATTTHVVGKQVACILLEYCLVL